MPALELNSRAAPSVVAHHRSVGPLTQEEIPEEGRLKIYIFIPEQLKESEAKTLQSNLVLKSKFRFLPQI